MTQFFNLLDKRKKDLTSEYKKMLRPLVEESAAWRNRITFSKDQLDKFHGDSKFRVTVTLKKKESSQN